jgi:hypothetical protein
MVGDWYARNLYEQGSVQNDHRQVPDILGRLVDVIGEFAPAHQKRLAIDHQLPCPMVFLKPGLSWGA